MRPDDWFGHENMGEVVEVGDGVDKVKVGKHVVLPFNISCGFRKNCERGDTKYCLPTQPEPTMAGAAYGFVAMGPWAGGNAELLRVPYGDHNALRLGEDASERENDDVMLADMLPDRAASGDTSTRTAFLHSRPGFGQSGRCR